MISLNSSGIKNATYGDFSFDSLLPQSMTKLLGHKGTLMCIKAHTGREIVKNDFLTILICWIYANYRNPTGYPQRSRDVKSSVASYPSSGQIFGTFPVETLRIAFRKENPIDLFEVSQGSREGRETSGQGVDRHIHVSSAV